MHVQTCKRQAKLTQLCVYHYGGVCWVFIEDSN